MRSPTDLETIVVTGASAGVGRAIALRFGRSGHAVGLIARDGEALEAVADEIRQGGGRPFAAPADVADAEALFAAADRIAEELGPIGVWINDAMVTVFARVWDMTPEEFGRVTDVTYLGVVHGTMAALRHMRPRDRGHIIQIGSALAYRGIPLQSAYCGAKHAIRGFTDSLRTELIAADSAISLTMMQLPAVNTPQFDWARTHLPDRPRPVPPVVQPEAIADAVYRAAHNPKAEYLIGRSTMELVLGNMAVPRFFDRYLRGTVQGQQRPLPVSPGRRDNLMRPVHDLHSTRGSFGSESVAGAVVLPGQTARVYAAVVGSTILLGLGALAYRALAGVRRG